MILHYLFKNHLQGMARILRYVPVVGSALLMCTFAEQAYCVSSSSSSTSSSSSSSSSSVAVTAPAQSPLFLTAVAKPHVALVMSVDQELSKKAYSDYANLDGLAFRPADTTYRDDFDYYGYFDSSWCYTYTVDGTTTGNSYFTPVAAATKPSGATYNAHQCAGTSSNTTTEAGAWSGNFLNWATMTRMDILRKVLFGGKRSVDSSSSTVLERAYLPKDIHAFSKQYAGTDVNKYTPYAYVSTTTPLSLCSVSTGPAATDYPIMRIARNGGKYPQWASSEGTQCGSGNSTSPASADITDVVVKVDACVTSKDGGTSQRCRQYGTSTLKKPAGLLQKYGEEGGIKFSLTTGSYKAHLKGGVVRVGASLIASNTTAANDEIALSTGIFNSGVNGIIKNINSIKVANYDWSGGKYSDCNSPGISVSTVLAGGTATQTCTDWGNPIAEIYLEMLRYISGQTTPTSDFVVDDSTAIGSTFKGVPGLTYLASWTDPWTEWCASCSAIVISTGANSFDGDDLGTASDVAGLAAGASAVLSKTDTVGTFEAQSLYGSGATFAGDYFMGGLSTTSRYCTANTVTNFSDIMGICPELPGVEGTYNIAGLAYHAHITDLRPGLTTVGSIVHPGKRNLNTYAIDLAESVPTFKAKIGTQDISFIPTCQSNNGTLWGSCTLIDVVVENLVVDASNNPISGSYLITWEDSNWGNDYDLDAAQRLEFCVGSTVCSALGITGVGATQIHITNSVVSAQAGFPLQFSYSIYGVNAASGTFYNNPASTYAPTTFNGGTVSTWIQRPGGVNFNAGSTPPNTVGNSKIKFTAGASTAVRPLNKPLWYAAKYGGFTDTNANNKPDLVTEWDNYLGVSNGVPDNFFNVNNPALLEDSLENVFISILQKDGSASAVATSSTRLTGNDFVYQAVFESKVWTGELLAYQPGAQGQLPTTPTYKTSDANRMPTSSTGRNIITYNAGTVAFNWANLTSTQQTALTISGEPAATSQARINWIRGDVAGENNATGFRERTVGATAYHNILGDIVNSGPTYAGYYDFGFDKLTAGGSTYQTHLLSKRTKPPLVLVGANDGMLHAFIGNVNPNASPAVTTADILTEKFAYIPSTLFSKLVKLSKPDYGNNVTNPHQYLVDGAIAVSDVYIGSAWRTIAVGSLGAGGKTIYGLDITNPSSPTILFEYTDPSLFGYVLGKIYIVPAQDGNWYAVFGNGAYSGTTSKLIMLKLDSPFTQTVKTVDAGAGTGLTSPSILIDGQGRITDAYSGDLSGNIWHFNLTSSITSSWSSYKVFAANANQPITASPSIGYNSILQKIMVYVGTGKYFDVNDNLFINTQQSFYAVPDNGPTGTPETRSTLFAQSLTTSYTLGAESRVVNWTKPWASKNGWYFDLDLNSTASRGERITSKAILIQDKLLITSLIPSQKTCESGGQSWLFEVPAVGDKYVNNHILSKNLYNQELYLGDQNFALGGTGPTSSAASSGSSSSSSSASPCASTMNVSIVNSGTNGQSLTNVQGQMCAGSLARQSWRQLR